MHFNSSTPTIRPATIPVMATACGVMVGNIYLCQPLLVQIAHTFGVTERLASLVAVATQIGYALGILLIVPLADVAEPKILVRCLFSFTAIGLVGAAFSPSVQVLVVASMCLSVTTVAPQVLIPLATSLTSHEQRGKTVGSLMTGLVLGILLSRTISGLVAQYSSWRASYGVAAVLTIGLLFFVPEFMPKRLPSGHGLTYGKLLATLPPLLRHRPLLLSMGMNFLTFGAFSAFWATLAFQLATPKFGLGPAAAGLFGLWGAPGALIAPMAGRLSDRWGSARVNAVAFAAVLLAFLFAGTLGAAYLFAMVVAVNLLDFGLQSGQVANQTRIFAIGHEIRARLNTLYMVSTFSGGAVGALAGGYAWTIGHWTGVCMLGGCLVSAASLLLGFSVVGRRAQVQKLTRA